MPRNVKQINIEIGGRIRAAREGRRMTREALAEACEITPRFLADVERGTVGPSLSTLRKICEVLGITSDSLLWGNCAADNTAVTRVTNLLNMVAPKYQALIVDCVEQEMKLLRTALSEESER